MYRGKTINLKMKLEQIMRSNLNTFKSKGSHSANVSAKFNSGLGAVDKKGRVKKS